jgi:CubicO group peptidase (beta-lactamase class C family)
MHAIDDFLRREVDLGSFAGAVYAIGTPEGIENEGAVGHAVCVPMRIEATTGTVYDCASLTKPLVTTTLVLQAVAEGRIALDQQFHGYTWRELLTHTSGLRAWMPLYAFDDPLQTLLEQGPECDRGTRVIYSDLNFILLWYALRELYGDFHALARQRIFEPLGLRDATLDPAPELKPRIAATEWGQRYETKMCAERKIACEVRQGLIWGQTHDGNSWEVGRGCAGNAGLFATACEVFRITQAFINGELVPRELAAEAVRNHTAGMSDGRGLGWQIGTGSAATEMLTPGSWGHTGFTGTSVWVDRERRKIMVLLANRVHPCAAPIAIQKIRGDFHRLALG